MWNSGRAQHKASTPQERSATTICRAIRPRDPRTTYNTCRHRWASLSALPCTYYGGSGRQVIVREDHRTTDGVALSKCGSRDLVARDELDQALLRRYANKAAFPLMTTSVQSLAFVANLRHLELLLNSGAFDFLLASRIMDDGGRSHNKALADARLIVAPLSVAHLPTTRSGSRMSRYRAGTASRGGLLQKQAIP